MARKPAPAPADRTPAINEDAIQQDMQAADTLALAVIQQNKRVTALALQLNYNGSTDPAVLENSAKDAIRRIGAGIFELGGYLLMLKEACPHGHFMPALERLGVAPRAAQQYMNVTRRFAANTKLTSHLDGASTKLVELLPLDDEQLGDLTDLGATGELALDDVSTMSVKQLREAVRKERLAHEATEQVLGKKNERIDRLERERQIIQKRTPDEQLLALKKESVSLMNDGSGLLRGELRQALIALNHATDTSGERGLELFMAGLVGQLQADLNALRDEFSLPDLSSAELTQLAAETAQWAPKKG